jgi:truncated hemoglobin YjbI
LTTPSIAEEDVFERIGEDKFARLVRGFWQVPGDQCSARSIRRRSRGPSSGCVTFWSAAGGPPRYVGSAAARLRMRHMPFAIDHAAVGGLR